MLLRILRRTPSQLHSLQQIPTQHDMLPQHLVYKNELNREYVITLARNDETPWWWPLRILKSKQCVPRNVGDHQESWSRSNVFPETSVTTKNPEVEAVCPPKQWNCRLRRLCSYEWSRPKITLSRSLAGWIATHESTDDNEETLTFSNLVDPVVWTAVSQFCSLQS